jgi:hypothetical protein
MVHRDVVAERLGQILDFNQRNLPQSADAAAPFARFHPNIPANLSNADGKMRREAGSPSSERTKTYTKKWVLLKRGGAQERPKLFFSFSLRRALW